MVRLISRQRGGLAALKLTKLFGIDGFPAAKNSGKVLIIIIYCYLIIIVQVCFISWSKNSRVLSTQIHLLNNELSYYSYLSSPNICLTKGLLLTSFWISFIFHRYRKYENANTITSSNKTVNVSS